MADYFVYILSNKSRMLYVGVTNNLERRLFEHRERFVHGFPERFGLTQLVYYEVTGNVEAAITREKEIKGWVRRKKTALIHSLNPEWKDLSTEWMPANPPACHSEGAKRLNESVLFGEGNGFFTTFRKTMKIVRITKREREGFKHGAKEVRQCWNYLSPEWRAIAN